MFGKTRTKEGEEMVVEIIKIEMMVAEIEMVEITVETTEIGIVVTGETMAVVMSGMVDVMKMKVITGSEAIIMMITIDVKIVTNTTMMKETIT